jgi:hypothetical protein
MSRWFRQLVQIQYLANLTSPLQHIFVSSRLSSNESVIRTISVESRIWFSAIRHGHRFIIVPLLLPLPPVFPRSAVTVRFAFDPEFTILLINNNADRWHFCAVIPYAPPPRVSRICAHAFGLTPSRRHNLLCLSSHRTCKRPHIARVIFY